AATRSRVICSAGRSSTTAPTKWWWASAPRRWPAELPRPAAAASRTRTSDSPAAGRASSRDILRLGQQPPVHARIGIQLPPEAAGDEGQALDRAAVNQRPCVEVAERRAF